MPNKQLILDDNSAKKIDVVIPYQEKDSAIIEMCVDGCIKNIYNLGCIYIVTKDTTLELDNVHLIDEDKLFDKGLSRSYIESRFRIERPDFVRRSGWIFQQFIKMGCSYALPNLRNYYLVVDSDVIFLRQMRFFKKDKMLLTKTKEYHRPYFNCYQRLLGKPARGDYSFVAHHMLMCKFFMLELLHVIEKRFNKRWYDAILDNIDDNNISMLSEYEIYGHYLEDNYPEKVIVRRLRNVQSFKIKYLLELLFNQADYATFHNYKSPQKNPRTNPKLYKLFLSLVSGRIQQQKRRKKRSP